MNNSNAHCIKLSLRALPRLHDSEADRKLCLLTLVLLKNCKGFFPAESFVTTYSSFCAFLKALESRTTRFFKC